MTMFKNRSMASSIASTSATSLSLWMSSRKRLPLSDVAARLSHVTRAKSIAVLAVLAALAIVGAASATTTLTPNQLGKCLDFTGRTGLRLTHTDDGLGLTREQILEAKSRVLDYWNHKTTAVDLSDLGFTPEQESTFLARVDAEIKRSSWPLGSPCAKFQNKTKVTAFLRQVLIDNGYRKVPMKFTMASPRQLRFEGVQDGYPMWGIVVRRDASHIVVRAAEKNTLDWAQSTLRTPFPP